MTWELCNTVQPKTEIILVNTIKIV